MSYENSDINKDTVVREQLRQRELPPGSVRTAAESDRASIATASPFPEPARPARALWLGSVRPGQTGSSLSGSLLPGHKYDRSHPAPAPRLEGGREPDTGLISEMQELMAVFRVEALRAGALRRVFFLPPQQPWQRGHKSLVSLTDRSCLPPRVGPAA